MHTPIRPLALAIGRTLTLLGLASMLILWLLPAAMAAQAATAT